MSRLFSTLLLIAAALLAGWLAFNTLTGSGIAGCSASDGCGTVLSSRWAYLGGGVPVSLLGLALYLSTLFAWTVGWRKLARVCEWTVLLGAAWFLLVQGFILHAFCPWCCATHAAAVLAVSIRWAFVGQRPDAPPPPCLRHRGSQHRRDRGGGAGLGPMARTRPRDQSGDFLR